MNAWFDRKHVTGVAAKVCFGIGRERSHVLSAGILRQRLSVEAEAL
jgi:hypothetical protein